MAQVFAFGAPGFFFPLIGVEERTFQSPPTSDAPLDSLNDPVRSPTNCRISGLVGSFVHNVLPFVWWTMPVLLPVVMKNGAEWCKPL